MALKMNDVEFLNQFKEIIEYSELSFVNNTLDVLSFSKLKYRGKLSKTRFLIKKRRKFNELGLSIAIGEGFLHHDGKSLIINIKVSAFKGVMLLAFIYGIFLIFMMTAISIVVISEEGVEGITVIMGVFIAAVFSLIPYLIMRDGARKLLTHLEQDFKSFERTK